MDVDEWTDSYGDHWRIEWQPATEIVDLLTDD